MPICEVLSRKVRRVPMNFDRLGYLDANLGRFGKPADGWRVVTRVQVTPTGRINGGPAADVGGTGRRSGGEAADPTRQPCDRRSC